jgi:hypothetical protein
MRVSFALLLALTSAPSSAQDKCSIRIVSSTNATVLAAPILKALEDAKFIRDSGPPRIELDQEIDDIQSWADGKRVEGYLRPTVRQFQESIQIDLELYQRTRNGFQVTLMKTVTGSATEKQPLLDLAADAARRIVEDAPPRQSGEAGRTERTAAPNRAAPLALAAVTPGTVVSAGTRVTLDAAPSVDPDHDAMVWHWCQSRGPDVLPKTWVGRRRVEFLANEPGEYTFALKVSDALHVRLEPLCPDYDEKKGSSTSPKEASPPIPNEDAQTAPADNSLRFVQVVVRRGPVALTPTSKLVEVTPAETLLKKGELASPATTVLLEGRCENCTRFRWRQTKGPSIALFVQEETNPAGDPKKRPSSCDGDWVDVTQSAERHPSTTCAFQPSRSGEYRFELIVANEISQDQRSTTVVVAPRPFVVLPPKQRPLKVDYILTLDASGSYDELDPQPRFRWDTVYSDPNEGPQGKPPDCSPAKQHSRGRVLIPTGRSTTFVASEPGTYWARLTMEARRDLPERALWSSECSTVKIEVTPRLWTIFTQFGLNTTKTLLRLQDVDSRLSVRIAANWMVPFLLGAGRLGLRAEWAAFSYASSAGQRRGFGGGASLTPSYTYRTDTRIAQFRAFLGPSLHRVLNVQRWGLDGGVDAVLELGRGWDLVGTVGGRLSWPKIAGERMTHGDARIAAGIGYEF